MNKPLIIENDVSIFFDIDKTLIFDPRSYGYTTEAINTLFNTVKLKEAYTNNIITVVVHTEHVELLKNHVNRGFKVILWSNNGVEHTKNVMEALNLQDYVYAIMSKPTKICDDLQPNEFLPAPIYIKDTMWLNQLKY